MASERRVGDLSEEFITHALRGRVVRRVLPGEKLPPSFSVSFGSEGHEARMQVWPEGETGAGVSIESEWGLIRMEGITQVGMREGRLLVESSRDGEKLAIEVFPSGIGTSCVGWMLGNRSCLSCRASMREKAGAGTQEVSRGRMNA